VPRIRCFWAITANAIQSAALRRTSSSNGPQSGSYLHGKYGERVTYTVSLVFRPSRSLNRHLIEIALQEAATRINEDSTSGAQVQIDSDTKGVPGTPPIKETILKKIEGCDLFVPDLKFVARTPNGKYVRNPNVMAEFGYALHAKTYAALMPIMNIAFGPAGELPFDLSHLRYPIQYHVDDSR
jgi:hypothetical protein